MVRNSGIRVHFQRQMRRETAFPLNRFGSVWISPDRNEKLPELPEEAHLRLEDHEPGEGYKRHVLVHGSGLEPVHFRLNENGHWEFVGDQYANLRSNGSKDVAPYQWTPLGEKQVVSAFIHPHERSRHNTYSMHAELDKNPVSDRAGCANANRFVEMGVEPRAYHSLIIVPGAKIQVEKEKYADEQGQEKERVIRNRQGRINLHLSELMKLRVREGLRQLVALHLKGIPAALAFSGGKLHYYEREPVEGMTPEDIQDKTEAGLMQDYMAEVLSSKKEFDKWRDETPETERERLPETHHELRELLGGNIRQMSFKDTFSQDGLGNALGVRTQVVEPRDGQHHFVMKRRFKGDIGYAEDVKKEGDEFGELKHVGLVVEEPFKARFMQHIQDEFPGMTTTAHVPPETEEVDKLLLKSYKSEYLKAMLRQGLDYILQNRGKRSDERADWLGENHDLYPHLKLRRRPPRPRRPSTAEDLISVATHLYRGMANVGRVMREGWLKWRNRGREQPQEEHPPEGEDQPPQPPQG